MLLSSWHLLPSLGLHHPEILALKVATFKGGRSRRYGRVLRFYRDRLIRWFFEGEGQRGA